MPTVHESNFAVFREFGSLRRQLTAAGAGSPGAGAAASGVLLTLKTALFLLFL
jgi:hypothetical protein